MKPSNRIALMFSLSAALLCGTALAQDAATAPAAAPAAAPTTMNDMVPPKPAHHHKAKAKAVSGSKYDNCLKENLADAQYYCNAHPDGCQAEKDGAVAQCKSEARGERQKG